MGDPLQIDISLLDNEIKSLEKKLLRLKQHRREIIKYAKQDSNVVERGAENDRFKVSKTEVLTVWDGEDNYYFLLPTGFKDDDTMIIVDGGPHFNGEVSFGTVEQIEKRFNVKLPKDEQD